MGTARSRPPRKQGFRSPSPIRFSRRTPSSADAVTLRRRSIRLHAVAWAVPLLMLWASPVHAHSGALTASEAVTQLAEIQVLSSLTTSSVLRQQIATALCLARGDCNEQRAQLAHDLTASSAPALMTAAASGLALLAARGDMRALSILSAAGS